MLASAYGPRERLNTDFSAATLGLAAQHPVGGVVWLGARIVSLVGQGEITAAEAANFAPTKDELENQVAVTAAAHRLAHVTGVPRDTLKDAVPFALEGLVMGSVISAGAEFSKGARGKVLYGVSVDGKQVPVIDIPTDEQREQFTTLLKSRRAVYFGNALAAITGILANPMHPVQEPLKHYHEELTIVSANYADNPARMAELGIVRDRLSRDLRPHLLNVLPRDTGKDAGRILVANITRSNPTGALIRKYRRTPQT